MPRGLMICMAITVGYGRPLRDAGLQKEKKHRRQACPAKCQLAPTGSESSLAADIPRQESGTDEGDRRGVDGAARATQRTDSIVPDAPSGVRHGEAGACNAPN
ncbi:hypothetical protein V500_03690 [Pseudogymnoascus sp. VKM F-4518 (FW-2643)]|nr:hypothetical protein V500_03690 [Pseudogymnoascus sp. VKM F-4518 (FW-2643)]